MNREEMPLVTLLTPCYNTGRYIHRLLDSVVEQDYPNIQMIVIDDGSTDNSAEVIKSYIPKFQKKGYILEYYYQENGGQSDAVNWGLKKVRGSYLLWPDSDDWYGERDTVSLLVETLRSLPEDYAMARTWNNYVDEKTLETCGVAGPGQSEAAFEDCLLARNFSFQAGCVIVDFNKLRELTSLEIYTDKNAGQNWQLYLPILYHYKCKTIECAKYNVLCRAASHSRGQFRSFDGVIAKNDSYEKTLIATLDNIPGLEGEKKEGYKKAVHEKYAQIRFVHALEYNNRGKSVEYRGALKALGLKISLKDSIKYRLVLLNLLSLSRWAYRLLMRH